MFIITLYTFLVSIFKIKGCLYKGFRPDSILYWFRLRNDAGKVRKLLESSRAVSYKDVSMLKLILTCGLYPQELILINQSTT